MQVRGRIPSLDGLRAISILLVIYGHARRTPGYPESMAWLGAHNDVANLGVRVFFVISGFLITSLLLDELEKAGRIDLRAFYLRRVFRIFPAFYAYMAVIVVGAELHWFDVPLRDVLLAVTYTINFQAHRSWYVGHTWSLSVEEQFYILWPAALALLLPRRGLWTAIGVIAAAPLFRLAWLAAWPEQKTLIGEAFPTIADAIAMGCVLAMVRERLGEKAGYLRFLRSPWFVLVPLLAFFINSLAPHARLFWAVGETFLDVSIALIVDQAIRLPETPVGKLLNARPVRFIGVLSYSLYLWQQPFLGERSTAWLCRFPQNLVCVAAAALASYYLVEKPVLRLRRRFSTEEKRQAAKPGAQAVAPAPGSRS